MASVDVKTFLVAGNRTARSFGGVAGAANDGHEFRTTEGTSCSGVGAWQRVVGNFDRAESRHTEQSRRTSARTSARTDETGRRRPGLVGVRP